MRFSILTLFPEALESYLSTSIIGRARSEQFISTQLVNIRDFATDKHKTVDDTPYGGGAGMVMKIEPIDKALQSLTSPRALSSPEERERDHLSLDKERSTRRDGAGEVRRRKVVVLSARGQQFTQAKAHEYAQLDELILICGRYEGIDQRVADYLADEEISIGPYVLAGGEIAALAVLEATARLLPGVLGNEESLAEESFSQNIESRSTPLRQGSAGRGNIEGDAKIRNSKFLPAGQAGEILTSFREYPHYTKPADYKGWKVPEILLSGNHEEIRRWRQSH